MPRHENLPPAGHRLGRVGPPYPTRRFCEGQGCEASDGFASFDVFDVPDRRVPVVMEHGPRFRGIPAVQVLRRAPILAQFALARCLRQEEFDRSRGAGCQKDFVTQPSVPGFLY